MTATITQQEIAKEICLQALKEELFAHFDRGSLDEISYNTQMSEQIGALYQAILSKVCETTEL